MDIYNYSLSGMNPFEYKGYIDFSKKVKGEELKNIIIGIDFFGTNKLKNTKFLAEAAKKPVTFFPRRMPAEMGSPSGGRSRLRRALRRGEAKRRIS